MEAGDGPVAYGICPECDRKYPQPKRSPGIRLFFTWFWRGAAALASAAAIVKLVLAVLRI